ncbi:hypothetical protein HGG76_10360 [Ochrobactrum tritici]|nr:hypothetical protein [Brucella tritici]
MIDWIDWGKIIYLKQLVKRIFLKDVVLKAVQHSVQQSSTLAESSGGVPLNRIVFGLWG